MTAVVEFVASLLTRRIELTLRRNRLHVWPGVAYKRLTDAEREFLTVHRDELKAMAADHLTVLPDNTPASLARALARLGVPGDWRAEQVARVAPSLHCPYCGPRACVGSSHPAFPTLHFNDPEEAKRRAVEATAVMNKMVRFGNPY